MRFTSVITNAVALVDASPITTDASLGNYFRVTLGANRVLSAPTNPKDGQKIVYEFIQDGSGNRTLDLTDAAFAYSTDIPRPTLSTAAGARDFLGYIYNSTAAKWYLLAVVKGF